MADRFNHLPAVFRGALLAAITILVVGAVVHIAADRWSESNGRATQTQDEMASQWLMAEERTCKICTFQGGDAGRPPERICGTQLDWARLAPRVRSCRPA